MNELKELGENLKKFSAGVVDGMARTAANWVAKKHRIDPERIQVEVDKIVRSTSMTCREAIGLVKERIRDHGQPELYEMPEPERCPNCKAVKGECGIGCRAFPPHPMIPPDKPGWMGSQDDSVTREESSEPTSKENPEETEPWPCKCGGGVPHRAEARTGALGWVCGQDCGRNVFMHATWPVVTEEWNKHHGVDPKGEKAEEIKPCKCGAGLPRLSEHGPCSFGGQVYRGFAVTCVRDSASGCGRVYQAGRKSDAIQGWNKEHGAETKANPGWDNLPPCSCGSSRLNLSQNWGLIGCWDCGRTVEAKGLFSALESLRPLVLQAWAEGKGERGEVYRVEIEEEVPQPADDGISLVTGWKEDNAAFKGRVRTAAQPERTEQATCEKTEQLVEPEKAEHPRSEEWPFAGVLLPPVDQCHCGAPRWSTSLATHGQDGMIIRCEWEGCGRILEGPLSPDTVEKWNAWQADDSSPQYDSMVVAPENEGDEGKPRPWRADRESPKCPCGGIPVWNPNARENGLVCTNSCGRQAVGLSIKMTRDAWRNLVSAEESKPSFDNPPPCLCGSPAVVDADYIPDISCAACGRHVVGLLDDDKRMESVANAWAEGEGEAGMVYVADGRVTPEQELWDDPSPCSCGNTGRPSKHVRGEMMCNKCGRTLKVDPSCEDSQAARDTVAMAWADGRGKPGHTTLIALETKKAEPTWENPGPCRCGETKHLSAWSDKDLAQIGCRSCDRLVRRPSRSEALKAWTAGESES